MNLEISVCFILSYSGLFDLFYLIFYIPVCFLMTESKKGCGFGWKGENVQGVEGG